MEKRIGMSQEEFDQAVGYKLQTHFTSGDMAAVMNLLRKYVNKNAVYCPGCMGTFGENKKEFYSWFNEFKSQIEKELAEPAIAAEQVSEYKNKK